MGHKSSLELRVERIEQFLVEELNWDRERVEAEQEEARAAGAAVELAATLRGDRPGFHVETVEEGDDAGEQRIVEDGYHLTATGLERKDAASEEEST